MQDYQREFVEFALHCQVLKFGQFTLKSGRISPYFYNSGAFDSGAKLARLASFYAAALVNSGARFDMLYGPAYKGIPLAAAVAVTLATEHGRDYPYAFNRKEAKDHGEGGALVGAALRGKVMIVDDVISAGTAVRESVDLIRSTGAEPTGVAIALDRQERGSGNLSAIQEIEEIYSLNVVAVCDLAAITEFLVQRDDMQEHLPAVRQYRAEYGVDK